MSLTKCSTSKAVALLAAVFLIAEVAAMQESNPCAHNDVKSMAPDEFPETLDSLISVFSDRPKEIRENLIIIKNKHVGNGRRKELKARNACPKKVLSELRYVSKVFTWKDRCSPNTLSTLKYCLDALRFQEADTEKDNVKIQKTINNIDKEISHMIACKANAKSANKETREQLAKSVHIHLGELVEQLFKHLSHLKAVKKERKVIRMAIKQKKIILPFDITKLILSYTFFKDEAHDMKAVYPELKDQAIENNFAARPIVRVHGAGYEACNGLYHYRRPEEEVPDRFDWPLPKTTPWYQKDENFIIYNNIREGKSEWSIYDIWKKLPTYYALGSSATLPEVGWKMTHYGPHPTPLVSHILPPRYPMQEANK